MGFYNYCGDYPGYAQEYLQASRTNCTALFLQGCAADQNPYPRGTEDLACSLCCVLIEVK